MGHLKKCLESGEYGKQLKDCHLFESNFVQVTRSGELANRVVMAVAASSPSLELPNLLLLARPVEYSLKECTCEHPQPALIPQEELQLIALLPLKFVQLYVHNTRKHQLKVSLANGRKFYLQLSTHPRKMKFVFRQWVRLLYRLHLYRMEAPITYQQANPNPNYPCHAVPWSS